MRRGVRFRELLLCSLAGVALVGCGEQEACPEGYFLVDGGTCQADPVGPSRETVLEVVLELEEGQTVRNDSVNLAWKVSSPGQDDREDVALIGGTYSIRRDVPEGGFFELDIDVRPMGLDTVVSLTGLRIAAGDTRTETVFIGRRAQTRPPLEDDGVRRLTVSTEPSGARIVVEDALGSRVADGTSPRTFELEPGEYVVRADLDRRPRESARVDLRTTSRTQRFTFDDPQRRVVVNTDPGDAMVRLIRRSPDGSEETVGEQQSPATFDVPSGIYGYEVSKPGFRTMTSGITALDAQRSDASTTVTLVPEEVGRVIDSAPTAECQEVIQRMDALSAPTDTRGAVGSQYAQALQRYGDCLANEDEFDRAILVADEILRINPAIVTARVLKGQIYCRLGDYAQGYRELQEAAGPFAADVPGNDRFAFRAVVNFHVARCRVDEFRASGDVGGLRIAAISALTRFIAEADEALSRRSASPVLLQQLDVYRSQAIVLQEEL